MCGHHQRVLTVSVKLVLVAVRGEEHRGPWQVGCKGVKCHGKGAGDGRRAQWWGGTGLVALPVQPGAPRGSSTRAQQCLGSPVQGCASAFPPTIPKNVPLSHWQAPGIH